MNVDPDLQHCFFGTAIGFGPDKCYLPCIRGHQYIRLDLEDLPISVIAPSLSRQEFKFMS
jgi:hypothetical protein